MTTSRWQSQPNLRWLSAPKQQILSSGDDLMKHPCREEVKRDETTLFWQQQYFCGWFLLTQRRSWLIDMSELLRDMSYFMCVSQCSKKKKSKLVFCSFQENVPLLFVCCTSKSQNHLGKGRGWRFSKDLASSLPASYSIPHTQTLARAEEKVLFVLLDLSLDIWFK